MEAFRHTILQEASVVAYLLEQQAIFPQALVEGSLEVTNISRRNLNFKIINERGPSYLLKQGIGKSNWQTLKRELDVYQYFKENDVLQAFVPNCYRYDNEQHIIILEFLKNARTIRQHHMMLGRFPIYLAHMLGSMIGTLHYLTQDIKTNDSLKQSFAGTLPFIFSIHQPDFRQFHQFSNANVELIKIIQSTREYKICLQENADRWQQEALIHGDIRWDNCLVCAGASGAKPRLKLIDWEYASLGDTCWDLGTVFSEYLNTWLLSVPVFDDKPSVELAQFPVEKMQPAFRAFWSAYKKHVRLQPLEEKNKLIKTIQYTGVKLLQSNYEKLQSLHQITNVAIYSLQLSLNMMRRPEEALDVLINVT